MCVVDKIGKYCVCACHGSLLVTQPAFPYGASSELIDRSSERAETPSHTTHRNSKATSRTYLLPGEQGVDTHYEDCPFASPRPGLESRPSRL